MGDAGGYKADDMWGPTETDPAWKRNDPMVNIGNAGRQQHPHLDLLRQRHAVRPRRGASASNLFNAKFLEGFTLRTNKTFQENYIAAGGKQRRVQLPGQRHAQLGLLGSAAAADEAGHPARAGRTPPTARSPGVG